MKSRNSEIVGRNFKLCKNPPTTKITVDFNNIKFSIDTTIPRSVPPCNRRTDSLERAPPGYFAQAPELRHCRKLSKGELTLEISRRVQFDLLGFFKFSSKPLIIFRKKLGNSGFLEASIFDFFMVESILGVNPTQYTKLWGKYKKPYP